MQRRVGQVAVAGRDLTDELDRFVAHWSYLRRGSEWMEVGRGLVPTFLVALQRTSVLYGPRPWWDPGARRAAARAADFLACFSEGSRFFTNTDGFPHRIDGQRFGLTDSLFDAGLVALGARYAGMWWHVEDEP